MPRHLAVAREEQAAPGSDVLAVIAAAALEVADLAASGGSGLISSALRLADATRAAEELAQQRIAVTAIEAAGYQRGYAAALAETAVRAVRAV
jgi:hypothetical protein